MNPGKKPSGKNDNGKKAWWKERLMEEKPGLFYKIWEKSLVSKFLLQYIVINLHCVQSQELKFKSSYN